MLIIKKDTTVYFMTAEYYLFFIIIFTSHFISEFWLYEYKIIINKIYST